MMKDNKEINRAVKRNLIKPLIKKSKHVGDQESFNIALERLDQLALSTRELPQVRSVFDSERQKRATLSQDNPEYIKSLIDLANILYEMRRISTQEYVYFACFHVINLHEDRWLNNQYDKELRPVYKAIVSIEKKHGLSPDEYWPKGKGPKEYKILSEQYSAILERKLIETLREFGLNKLADLKETQPEEFDKLVERGRRALAHRDEYVLALKDIIDRYVEDARRSASVNAYSSAVTSLAASAEGLLLLRCLKSKHKASSIAKTMPKCYKPKRGNDPTTWKFQTLIEVCSKAGWFNRIESKVAVYYPSKLADWLRSMRNYVHPSRRAKQRPWLEADEREYKDAEAIYVILHSALGKARSTKKKS